MNSNKEYQLSASFYSFTLSINKYPLEQERGDGNGSRRINSRNGLPQQNEKESQRFLSTNLRHGLFAISPDVNEETSSTLDDICDKRETVTPEKVDVSDFEDDGRSHGLLTRQCCVCSTCKQINHDEPPTMGFCSQKFRNIHIQSYIKNGA